MFDVYMQEQSFDPRVRRRLVLSGLAALAVTTGAIALSWTLNQFSIGRVSAPKVAQQVMLSLSADPPPPPAPPPRPKAAAAAGDNKNPTQNVSRRRPQTPEPPAEDALPSIDGTAKPRTGGVPGPKGRSDFGGPPSGPGCLGPLCGKTLGIGRPPGVPRISDRPQDTTVRAPLAHVKARSLFTPDPDVSALAKTATGLMSRRSGRVTVSFCVAPSGKVHSAKVAKRFGKDPAVDDLCRKAVAKWRFKAAKLGGKARTICSDVTFDLRFEQ